MFPLPALRPFRRPDRQRRAPPARSLRVRSCPGLAGRAAKDPKGAADALKKGMPNPMGDLIGPFLTQPNEKYDVSFAGAPTGLYKGYCMPHVALGMRIAITVQ